MVPRHLTAGLLAAMTVLGVTFTVIMGFYLLVQQLGDKATAVVLSWTGRICLVLLTVTFVLLVLSLALDSLATRHDAEQ